MSKILYVAGYGRSGSTLLSILLDNLTGVTALGGVAGLPTYLGVPGRECTCNRPYVECPLWSEVIDGLPDGIKFIKRLGRVQRQVEPWNKGMRGLIRRRTRKEYSHRTTNFLKAVERTTGARILVDSSKSAYSYMWRALALREVGDLDIFVIHLVRRATDVVSSCKKGRNVDLERGDDTRFGLWASSVGLAGWVTSNLAALRIRRKLESTRSMVVRYRDLVHSPKRELQRIINRIDLTDQTSADTVFQKDRSLRVGHLVGSNRMARRNRRIQIDPAKVSSPSLSQFEKVIVEGITTPIEKIILS